MDSVTPAVQVIDLVKRYSARSRSGKGYERFLAVFRKNLYDIQALNGASFTVYPGEVFGLLGPNGAGKTTIMKILATLVIPDGGLALVKGLDVVKHPRRTTKNLQAVLAESVGFERRLTGRDNLEFYAGLYGLTSNEARKRIDELLGFAGLSWAADQMFQKYSTGMSRKLLVCRALLSDASILLFDEPTSGLDPVAAVDFRNMLRTILAKERGKTVIISTHNLWEAQQICDRIALLKKGRIIATGTPAEIRRTVADKVSLTLALVNPSGILGTEISRSLSRIDGITRAELTENNENGGLMLRIEGTRDINYTRIFDSLSSMGLTIASLEASQPSLEEAFITLTRESV